MINQNEKNSNGLKTTAVIMAGGKGERFWPKSRSKMPKQFLSLTGDGKTMIQLTVERILPLVSAEDIFIVTNKDYLSLAHEQLPELPIDNILAEPMAKNTAPCIGLAATVIANRYQDAVMLVLPSDHLIKHTEMYLDTLRSAVAVAEDGENLVTLGITPNSPETGYGYINFSAVAQKEFPGVYKVNRFVEKPSIEVAKEYLSSGQYLWNSGMFIWKVSTILGYFKKLLPDVYQGLMNIGQAIGTPAFTEVLYRNFLTFNSVSIDYGIMEQAENIYTLPGSFGWDDVGSWLSIERFNKTNDYGNVIQGDVITVSTARSTILGGKKLIAAIGLEEIIVIDTDDAILICSKEHTQEIKKVVENLKICNRNDMI